MENTTIQTILTRAEIEDALAAKVRELYPERNAQFTTVDFTAKVCGILFQGDAVEFLQATVSQERLLAGDDAAPTEDLGMQLDDRLVLHHEIAD